MIRQTTLTVSRLFHRNSSEHTGYRSVPFIRLSGLYLEQAGIREGSTINVTVHQGNITISPV